MSFILCTGSLNIWHCCTGLKGQRVALLSGVSPGRNNGTMARWLGCQQNGLRRDAPRLSWLGVPPEKSRPFGPQARGGGSFEKMQRLHCGQASELHCNTLF